MCRTNRRILTNQEFQTFRWILEFNSSCYFLLASVSYCTYYYFQITHCSLQGLLCDLRQTFQLSPPGVSTRVTTREHPAAEGGTVDEKCPGILPKCRLTRYIQGSFTCRKAATWDRRLYVPSEERHAEDFFRPKYPRVQAGCEPANLGTKGQHATSRPPKPLNTVRRYVPN